MLAKQILGVLLILGLSAFFTTPAVAIDEMQTLTPNAGAISPSASASFIQSTPGLLSPLQLVNLYGSNQTGGPITTFYEMKPDGSKVVFAIPAGKYLVITAIHGEVLHTETNIPYGYAYLSIFGGSNALCKAYITTYSVGGINSLPNIIAALPPLVTGVKPKAVLSLLGTPVTVKFFGVRIFGYLYEPGPAG